MSDAHCKKHFINYCPELSARCPYCRIAELEADCKILNDSNDELRANLNSAEAKLAAVAEWYERNRLRLFDVNDDELKALLKEQNDE